MTFPVSKTLARFAAGLQFDGIPDDAKRIVKRSFLDQTGAILAANTLGSDCVALVDMAIESGGSGARILGFNRDVSPAFAAFANGAMAHSVDFEDTHDATLVHPTAPVLPAALAIAQSRGATGRDLLTALCVGMEVTIRIGQSLIGNPEKTTGFLLLPFVGVFGATAAAGRLLNLTAPAMEQAFSIALGQVVASTSVQRQARSSLREIRDGFNAKAAVIAAGLAKRGVTSFAEPFEGPNGYYDLFATGAFDETAFARLGQIFEVEQISYKPWPSCRGTHVFVEAALELQKTHDISVADIAEIHVGVSPFFETLCVPAEIRSAPASASSAKFSIPFSVASCLLSQSLTLNSFLPEALVEPTTIALAEKVSHSVVPLAQNQSTRGRLTISTRSGGSYAREIDTPKGHPDRPMSDAEISSKFLNCAAFAKTATPTDALRSFMSNVADLEHVANVNTVVKHL